MYFPTRENPASMASMARAQTIPCIASVCSWPRSLFTLAACSGILLFCTLPSPARAQGTPKPSVAPSTPPGYAQGITLLHRAGLPDVKGWKFVYFDSTYRDEDHLRLQLLQIEKPCGNAWVEPEPDANGLRRIIINGFMTVAFVETDDDETYARLLPLARARSLDLRVGKIRDADEQESAALLATALARSFGERETGEKLLLAREYLTTFFFLAAHLYHRGQVTEGSQMLDTLGAQLPTPGTAVALAVDALADMRLRRSLAQFRADQDWRLLQDSMDVLLKDFPNGWQSRPHAERLLGQARLRLAGQTSPELSTDPFPLTAEQKAWWQDVTTHQPALPLPGDSTLPDLRKLATYWIAQRCGAPEELLRQLRPLRTRPAESALFDIRADWDWLAIMGAAVGDLTPTHFCKFDPTFYYSSTHSGTSMEPLHEEAIEYRWQALNRPCTRDDIARAFLSSALPTSGSMTRAEEVWYMSATELRALTREWQARLAPMSPLECARVYREGSTESRLRLISSILAATGDDSDLAALETLVFQNPEFTMPLAAQILQRRQAAGRPFLERYKAEFVAFMRNRGYSAGSSTETDAQKRNAAIAAEFGDLFSAMESHLSGKRLQDVLLDFGEDRINDEWLTYFMHSLGDDYVWTRGEIEQLFSTMASLPKSEEAGRKRRSSLLGYAREAIAGHFQINLSNGWDDTPDEKQRERALPDWVLNRFREVIEQNRDVETLAWGSGRSTLSQEACHDLEVLSNPDVQKRLDQILKLLPEEDHGPFLEARAQARLAGRKAPPLPDEDRVPAARRQAIKEALDRFGEGRWNEFFGALSLDEKLAALSATWERQPDASWRKPLTQIIALDTKMAPATHKAAWSAYEGQHVDGDSLKRLLASCQAMLGDGVEHVRGAITPRSHLRGMNLLIEDGNPDNSHWLTAGREPGQPAPDFTAIASIRLYGISADRNGTQLFLLGKDGQWKLHSTDSQPYGPLNLPPRDDFPTAEKFTEILNLYLDPTVDKLRNVSIEFGVSRVVPPNEDSR